MTHSPCDLIRAADPVHPRIDNRRLKMKLTYIAALAAVIAMTAPAFALTAVQVGNEVAGYHCSGNVCTNKVPGTVTTKDADIIKPGYTIPAGTVGHTAWGSHCGPFMIDLPFGQCVMQEADIRSGGSLIPDSKIVGATHVNPVCNTTTKTLGFDPRGGANGFTVSASQSQSAGAC